jgi:hypothetical protein
MRFRISRVSDYTQYIDTDINEEPVRLPCPEATHDVPTRDTDNWEHTFSIEISTLEELLDLTQKYGKIVLRPDRHIEIYDYYRE